MCGLQLGRRGIFRNERMGGGTYCRADLVEEETAVQMRSVVPQLVQAL
jgi:hypothetical protein